MISSVYSWSPKKIAVKVIVINEKTDRVLILKRHRDDGIRHASTDIPGGLVDMPQGGRRPWEQVAGTLVRIDTGIDDAAVCQGTLGNWYAREEFKDGTHPVAGWTCIAMTRQEGINLSKEYRSFSWVKFEDIEPIGMGTELRREITTATSQYRSGRLKRAEQAPEPANAGLPKDQKPMRALTPNEAAAIEMLDRSVLRYQEPVTIQEALVLLDGQPAQKHEMEQLLERYEKSMEGKDEKAIIEAHFVSKLQDWIYWSIEKHVVFTNIEDFIRFRKLGQARAFLKMEKIISPRVLVQPVPEWLDILHCIVKTLVPAVREKVERDEAERKAMMAKNLIAASDKSRGTGPRARGNGAGGQGGSPYI